MIRIGTSGFSYDDWIGPFYPEGLPAREQLAFYTREFSTVEINTTYYRVPICAWCRAGRRRRRPTSSSPSRRTRASRMSENALTSRRSWPRSSRWSRLASWRACWPSSPTPFTRRRTTGHYLGWLREGLGDLPAVIELRHADWVTPATFELLRSLGLGFCCVDEPHLRGLLPPVAVRRARSRTCASTAATPTSGTTTTRPWERYNYTYPAR